MKPDSDLDSEKLIWFRSVCISNGIEPTIEQLKQMKLYVQMLIEWNKKVNLVSRKDIENVWENHILHCIAPLFQLKISPRSVIADIGTGGGLPGIPIKILLPQISLLCIDSVGKKVKAVTQMINSLDFSNAFAICGRAEEIAKKKEYIGKFDFVIARSVTQLSNLWGWSIGFFRKNKTETEKFFLKSPALLTYKGGDLRKEIEETKVLYKNISIEEISLQAKGTNVFYNSEKKLLIVREKPPAHNKLKI